MNVVLLDPSDRQTAADAAARVEAAAGRSCRVCRMTRALGSDGPPSWKLRFAPGDGLVRTRREPDGLVPAVLLAVDEFAGEDELAIVAADAAQWSKHFQRIPQALASRLDVFLSFEAEGPGRFVVDPDVTTLLHLTNGLTPALAWYRTTDLFVDAAKQVIRKDARWNGQFSADSLLRELALHDARVGYHGRPMDDTLAAA
ncbi:MAG: hypothetical protein KF873_16705 [Gemmataceae bacterium]|nr:hypothetical protein [Planctomycetia bacterium]MBX3400375.1 hypothetical protein [Gemmataceae bacterium]